MSSQINWLVKGYPYSLHRTNPTAVDNGFLVSHIWINTSAETAFILSGITSGAASWTSRAPDYILNAGTEHEVRVIEKTASGTVSTGGPTGEYHIQGTDQALDMGGPNQVTVEQTKSAINTAQNGEIMLTPKAAALGGAEGTVFYNSLDDHIYVGTEP